MSFRYICPHCQGSGNKYGLRLLSFIKCKVCNGDGNVLVSINSEYSDVKKKSENEEQPPKEESQL